MKNRRRRMPVFLLDMSGKISVAFMRKVLRDLSLVLRKATVSSTGISVD